MFIWDERKRKQVIEEHAIDFAEIEDIFDDPLAIFFEDYAHSTQTET